MRATAWAKFAILCGTAALTGGLTGSAALGRERLTPQQQLDKLLEGRVAEKPVNCINHFDRNNSTVINNIGIVYGSGAVIYVNRPPYPQGLNDDQILVTRTTLDELCSLDIVELRERSTFFFSGSMGLGQFVPYRRLPRATSH